LRCWLAINSQDSQAGSLPSGRTGGGTPPIARRLPDSVTPSPRRNSGELRRAVAPADPGDTLTDAGSTATPSITKRASESGISPAKGSQKGLRVATPLGAAPSSPRDEAPISLDDVLSSAAAPSASGARPTSEMGSLVRRQKKALPSKWIWLGIGAAMIGGLVLVVIEIMLQSR
jgi:hypothetical protein